MRIAIGQLWQETNTFNPLPTTRADFEAVRRPPRRRARRADGRHQRAGRLHPVAAPWPERPEIVGLVRLPAWPSGTATPRRSTGCARKCSTRCGRACRSTRVLLALHGAMVADGAPDVEGEILEAVRAVVGPSVPLVATLDLHANVTRRMVEAADALVLYHTAPHVDVFETGQRGAAVLRRILIDGARPVTAFQKLPLVVPAERANTQDPASVSYGFRQRLQRAGGRPAASWRPAWRRCSPGSTSPSWAAPSWS